MEIIGLAVTFCVLITFGFIADFYLKLIKSAWFDFKKKEYKREPFANGQDWKQLLLYVAIISVGIWGFYRIATDSVRMKYEPEYIGTCCECGTIIIDGSEITAFDTYGDYLCPYCANRKIKKIINGESNVCSACGSIYDNKSSGQYGMCEDCEGENLVPCSGCDEPTIDWNSEIEMVFCPRCMGDIITDKAVQRDIERYLNS